MRKTFLSAALLMSVAWPAFAQTPAEPTPPAAFAGVEGLNYQGTSGGMDYWYFDNTEFLISRNQADGSISIGYVFNEAGDDVSAAITGAPPLTFESFLPPVSEEEDAPLNDSPDQVENSSELSDLVPQPGIAQQDNRLLESAPESVRNELLAILVERLSDVQTREEYENIILAWREEVRETLGQQPAPIVPQDIMDMLEQSTETPDVAAEDIAPSEPEDTSSVSSLMPPAPSAQDAQAPSDESVPETGDMSDIFSEDFFDAETLAEETDVISNPITSLMPSSSGTIQNPAVMGESASSADVDADAQAFETLSMQSRWFSLGDASAPIVYVVIDPTCPYCARTLVDLEDDIMNGDLQLRVVMAGLLSDQAIETVAGILLSESPAQTLFENAHARAGGEGQQAPRRNATDLPAEVQNDLAVNRQNIVNLNVNQVPYFAWETESGFKTASGVPTDGQFDDALSEVSAQ